MKKETIKILRKISRERIPIASLKGKVIPSKKKELIKKALKKELQELTEIEDEYEDYQI